MVTDEVAVVTTLSQDLDRKRGNNGEEKRDGKDRQKKEVRASKSSPKKTTKRKIDKKKRMRRKNNHNRNHDRTRMTKKNGKKKATRAGVRMRDADGVFFGADVFDNSAMGDLVREKHDLGNVKGIDFGGHRERHG